MPNVRRPRPPVSADKSVSRARDKLWLERRSRSRSRHVQHSWVLQVVLRQERSRQARLRTTSTTVPPTITFTVGACCCKQGDDGFDLDGVQRPRPEEVAVAVALGAMIKQWKLECTLPMCLARDCDRSRADCALGPPCALLSWAIVTFKLRTVAIVSKLNLARMQSTTTKRNDVLAWIQEDWDRPLMVESDDPVMPL